MPDIDFAILPASYKDLSVANVESNRQLLRDLWQSAEPQLDVDRGALSMLVLNPAATLLEVGRETFRTARKSSSFTALLADSSEAAAPMLDELARSYRVTRRSGSIASGRIRLFFNENVPRTIGLSTTFQANGMLFKVRNVETLFSSHEPPSTLPHTQNLRHANDGSKLLFADVTVYAQAAGSAGNLVRGTELSLYQSAIPYFARAVAMETFSGGENDESNDSLVQRMVLGVSAKVLSSRVNMRASLLEKFPDIRDSSVIGAGDPEMTRDKHTIFPVGTGGCVDWYVGTTRQLQSVSTVVEDPLQIDTLPDGRIAYMLDIADNMIPCLYHVTAIQDEETLEYYEIQSQTRFAQDNAGLREINTPRIPDDVEGAFTAWQTTEVRFLARKSVGRVRIDGLCMPGIREIQGWVLHCSQAPVGLDILVKGAIPTTVQFSAVLHTPAGEPADHVMLQNAVADHINRVPFGGLLAVSGLVTLLHENIPSGSYVTKPVLFATTYLPDGRILTSQTSDRLVIDFPPYASNRTTMFYCDPADVSFEQRHVERGVICG